LLPAGGAYHSVKALTSNEKVGGLPKILVCALLSNIDGRLCLLARYPGLDGWLNGYTGLGTNDVELAFSALAKRAGWKAPATFATAEAASHNSRFTPITEIKGRFILKSS
jgi:hypothetical protein